MASSRRIKQENIINVKRVSIDWFWWLALIAIWAISTWFDRTWLSNDQRLPSWDQAEYLSSALEHGRGLGLLAPGEWNGWQALMDLSPKIPPLSALISGSVMAITGEASDKASWVLSLWHGLLIVTLAMWGRVLGGRKLGVLAAVLLVLSPAMAEHRVEFSLDLPLTTSCTLALFLLFQWQRPAPIGGTWKQAIAAALSIGASLLIKQSALLVLALPSIWVGLRALPVKPRRRQTVVSIFIVLSLLMPWLHHNWITTIGGTQRAVLISGAKEGDPGILNPLSLIWYPRLMPDQLGILILTIGIAGIGLALWNNRKQIYVLIQHPVKILPKGWPWLIGVTLMGWICTSLSPNKDARYIAPVLPMLILLITKGWLLIIDQAQKKIGRNKSWAALIACILVSGFLSIKQRWEDIVITAGSPAVNVLETINRLSKGEQTTLFMVSSDRNLNEQTLSYLGQINGRNIQARRLGRNKDHEELSLAQSKWWVLATGDQGTSRKSRQQLSRAVRKDSRFELIETWDWDDNRQIELWRRRNTAEAIEKFDNRFIKLARGLEKGPAALEPIFKEIEIQHLLDPGFNYQQRVETWANNRLQHNQIDQDALWSLALLRVLQNRPGKASLWFRKIESVSDEQNWASIYNLTVLLADWKTCKAAWLADNYLKSTFSKDESNLLFALRDLSRAACFDPRGPIGLATSLKPAIESVEKQINGDSI